MTNGHSSVGSDRQSDGTSSLRSRWSYCVSGSSLAAALNEREERWNVVRAPPPEEADDRRLCRRALVDGLAVYFEVAQRPRRAAATSG